MRHLLTALLLTGTAGFAALAQLPATSTLHLVCAGAGTSDQVNVDIVEREGRIRLPQAMVPKVNGARDGWFALKNIQIGHDEITASAELNPAISTAMSLDRATAAISLTGGSGAFSGKCQPSAPPPRPKS